MKLDIQQKQKIYEHLLKIGCLDLLAALIAERTEPKEYNHVLESSTICSAIWSAFVWSKSPEGFDFWNEIQDEIHELENTVPAGQEHEDALQKALEDDFESPTEKDFAPKGEEVKIEIKTESYRPPQPSEYVEWLQEQTIPSFFDKVKLFFGKVFYKI